MLKEVTQQCFSTFREDSYIDFVLYHVILTFRGWGFPNLTFFNFSCQNEKLQSMLVYQKLCLNHFQTVTTLTIFYEKTCTKETPRDTITLEGLQEKITTEADQGF